MFFPKKNKLFDFSVPFRRRATNKQKEKFKFSGFFFRVEIEKFQICFQLSLTSSLSQQFATRG